MTISATVLTLTLLPAGSVFATPGDPRLVQGTLEWHLRLPAVNPSSCGAATMSTSDAEGARAGEAEPPDQGSA